MSFMSTAPRPQTQSSSVLVPPCWCAGAAGVCGADVAREGVNLPVRRIRRDDVEVAVQEQGRPGLVLAGDAGDHAGPAGRGFQDGRLEADLGEERGDVLGRLALAGTGVVAPVGRIDPDQVAAQAGDLVLSGDVVVARGGWSLRHHPMVAPGWVEVVGWLPSWVAEHLPVLGDGHLLVRRGTVRRAPSVTVAGWRLSCGARPLGAWWGGAGGCFAGRGRICYREAADPGRYRGLAYVRVAE